MHVPLSTGDFLIRAWRCHPDEVALSDSPGELGVLTWRQFATRVATAVVGLDSAGIEAGARVAVISPNRGRVLELIHAIPSSGRVLVPINPRLSVPEITHIVGDSGARIVFADPELAMSLQSIPVPVISLGSESDKFFGHDSPVEPEEKLLRVRQDENATATLNYTSGTTSAPKGVQLTHRNIWLTATTLGLHAGLRETDVYLHTLPLFHVNGWEMPYITASLGIHNVMLSAIRGDAVLDLIRDHGVTVLCGAPTVLSTILAALPGRSDAEVPGTGRVRVICAGAAPSSALIERVERELGWEFIQVFGLTETSPMVAMNRIPLEHDADPSERAAQLTKQGFPFLGTDLDFDDKGQVLVRSNHVMSGYYQRADLSAQVLANDWFQTGDAGRLDEVGRLEITDRLKDVIVTGGENVSSLQVEECLATHPAVWEVAVTGRPHEKWGEAVTAFVVLAPDHDVTEADLIEWARERLAHYKAPSQINFTLTLPRTATGKVQKNVLRAQIAVDA